MFLSFNVRYIKIIQGGVPKEKLVMVQMKIIMHVQMIGIIILISNDGWIINDSIFCEGKIKAGEIGNYDKDS